MAAVDGALIHEIADGVVGYDSRSNEIQTVNDACTALLGYSDSELIGADVTEMVARAPRAEGAEAMLDEYVRRARGGESIRFTWWAATASGDELPLEAHLTVTDERRELALVTLRDVSGRRDGARGGAADPRPEETETRSRHRPARGDRDARSLGRETEGDRTDTNGRAARTDSGVDTETMAQRYRQIVQQLLDVLLILDEAGTITYCSPKVTDEFGQAPAELIGTNAFDGIHPADRRDVKAAHRELFENPETETSVEYRIPMPDGTVRWFEARGRNCVDDSIIEGVMVTTRDITERKAYEQRIRTQNRMLERLASIVSHDLETPLSTASKLVNVLRADIDPADRDAATALEKLEAVVGDLREFADHLPELAQQSTHVEEPIACDLGELARSAWNAVETGGLELRLQGTRTLEGDPNRLRRIFQNAFENATTHATGATRVTIGTTSNGFYVEDDGVGIDGERSATVFDYGETTGAGSGMGLAIVRTIVEAHGWSIDVTDGESGGARFEVRTDPE